MNRLFDAYRAIHEQAFVPIFCADGMDSKKQVAASVAAGCTAIEYTLRKPDAREMIPWIRKNYPDTYLLVGSTIDNDAILKQMRRRHPQLTTLDELADWGVDGFVSMLSWTERSIRQYAPTHVVVPTAMTVGEALAQTSWGAHFQKLAGSEIGFVKRCRGAAAFGYCPIMVTGGQTLESMPESFKAGAILVGSGFDLTLAGRDDTVSEDEIAQVVRSYLKVAQESRAAVWPELACVNGGAQAWLDALPHYHPF